jgi:hypothetical protein
MNITPIANGTLGLQCHTAPFSWKIVFEYDHRLFELTMTACSLKEELEWRNRLTDRFSKDTIVTGEQAACTSLSLDIRPMGVIFGKPGENSSYRRSSVDGAVLTEAHIILTICRNHSEKNLDS